eukprot:CAMPEP_0197830922 /NCGR_PEP_ID=MMETSP1437-20131217/7531_1 /TAXON_ID=49252 ORGANISM="Eucampia antarctica, Strain CCMP1452" /NCGR_SAMPLE_ID=MMETSP1437 /ASSEMBLY_ACC=CAM_ASM_001096 /LENGTH=207 /DNA_ID=CAMNT_0043433617 /DNA_START=825 /DNA_END=1445 /DNA_ORIENTATION=+
MTDHAQALEYIHWQWMQIHQFFPKNIPTTRTIQSSRHSHFHTKDLMHHLFQSLSSDTSSSPPNDIIISQQLKKTSLKYNPAEQIVQWKQRRPQLMTTTLPSSLAAHVQLRMKRSSLNALLSFEENEEAWQIGDFAETFVEGDDGWFRGQVVAFNYNEDEEEQFIEVMFDDGVLVDDNTPNDLRMFVPYVEDELVWIIWPEEEEEEEE